MLYQTKIQLISVLLFLLTTLICTAQESTQIISAPIVQKNFFKKNNVATEHLEYYVERSIQDYFIKFCESGITAKELQKHLASLDSEIEVLTMEVELREGNWDICHDNENQQSRIGEYIVIHRIIVKQK